MKKIRVLFPYVEAGLGHIMPMRAVEEIFKNKYGNKFEIVDCNFFTDTNNKKLLNFRDFLVHEVVTYNKHPSVGFFATRMCELLGTNLSTYGTMALRVPGSRIEGIKYMESLHPDVVFSTHWATNYYAEKMKKKPFTISYCPDAVMNKLFEYKADLSLISMPNGYNKAIKMRKYNENNLKIVPFLLRNQVFSISTSKEENRKELGLPLDKFTVIVAEGGYGVGKMAKICKKLANACYPITVIAICGKNEALYNEFKELKVNDNVTFVPLGFTDKILMYEAASDLFLGKSGNIIAEPTFFGVPSVITNFATLIEKNIGEHYINTVGSAMKEFDPDKIVAMIKSFQEDPSLLEPYIQNALAYHDNFGAEATADLMYQEIMARFKRKEGK